jgi:hypothetical protein
MVVDWGVDGRERGDPAPEGPRGYVPGSARRGPVLRSASAGSRCGLSGGACALPDHG